MTYPINATAVRASAIMNAACTPSTLSTKKIVMKVSVLSHAFTSQRRRRSPSPGSMSGIRFLKRKTPIAASSHGIRLLIACIPAIIATALRSCIPVIVCRV